MANRSLFATLRDLVTPPTDLVNEGGGPAYALPPKHALAQYAATGCLNGTYYASAETQLETVLRLSGEVPAEFVAKAAVHAREVSFMKDMPALLCAVLAARREHALLRRVFPRVIDSGKMLRNFVQILRSGVTGRKSLGTVPKALVRAWLLARSDEQVFFASVGERPSIADIVKMVHPRPATDARKALYGWLIGKDIPEDKLPTPVAAFERFKRDGGEVPDVPFEMLTALDLDTTAWTSIARRAGWTLTRMSLGTFARHGVFGVDGMTGVIAARLRDAGAIERARAFPYQLLAAHANAGAVPDEVKLALQDALEIATRNVPEIAGRVFVFPDVSGSMLSPATGHRRGSTTAVRCVDVAALFAAAILRRNPSARVIPFAEDVVDVPINPRDSVMTNAERLAAVGGGGTNCSAPLALLNRERAKGDLCVYVSDNQSWVDAGAAAAGSATLRQWNAFLQRNPRAKLVCIDVAPYGHTQAAERDDILNVGGFSDGVFEVVSRFARDGLEAGHWVGVIEEVKLEDRDANTGSG